ncbi:hypothetical protein HZH68_010501 [Vespula germanica]|uniref:Uncharacterized protein n=1 Tax=Vespula germanica TaxID=30212 RepID=A0A834JSS7_VESGE|nr:hypothetical protein HZH68_010501 [Vespula germanica]
MLSSEFRRGRKEKKGTKYKSSSRASPLSPHQIHAPPLTAAAAAVAPPTEAAATEEEQEEVRKAESSFVFLTTKRITTPRKCDLSARTRETANVDINS